MTGSRKFLLSLVALTAACTTNERADIGDTAPPPPSALQIQANEFASKQEIPAIGLALLNCDTREVAIAGVLRADDVMRVSSTARFAIGSNSKSMLATAAARLSQKGRLSLDASLKDLWPEAAERHPDKQDITLAQLLGHASGLPAFDTGKELGTVPEFTGTPREIGAAAAEWFLAQPLANTPGETSVYSNAGYVVAAELISRSQDSDFRRIVEEEVFTPLGLDAAYGEPRRLGSSHPHGHTYSDGKLSVYEDEEPPIPTWLEGAGNVSITAADYATYLQAHLCSLQGRGDYLEPEIARRLHIPVIEGGAALGWGVTELGGSTTSFHIGGTGDFTAYMALAADKDRGALAVFNVGGTPASVGQSWLIESMTAE